MLTLLGSQALSEFRIQRLLERLQALEPAVTALSAQFVHLVDCRGELDALERARLEQLLADGGAPMPPSSAAAAAAGASWAVLVLPRPGTISPWSSKASDIAQVCGLQAVRRIERGVRYTLALSAPAESARR